MSSRRQCSLVLERLNSDDLRSLPSGANHRATTLYSVDPLDRTMMQPCASAAKLRAGPILRYGLRARSDIGLPTSDRSWHRRKSLSSDANLLPIRLLLDAR